ncbi:MAG: hypothetical protein NTX76_04475 [Alphaproteobacteria bacterium]|nr:hypothetical protein [Alphaproteobacteria bacterium]
MKKISTILLSATMLTSAAFAGSAPSATGFYVGASAAAANTNVKYTLQTSGAMPVGAPGSSQALSTSDRTIQNNAGKLAGLFGAFAGYGMSVGQGFYLGGEAFGGFDTTKLPTYNDVVGTTGYGQANVKRSNYYGLAARIGYMITPSTLAYVRLGVEAGKWTAQFNPNAAAATGAIGGPGGNAQSVTQAQATASSQVVKKSKNSISFAPGLGLEVFVSKNVFMRAEYSYLFGPKMDLTHDNNGFSTYTMPGTSVKHSFKITQQAMKIAVGYKF